MINTKVVLSLVILSAANNTLQIYQNNAQLPSKIIEPGESLDTAVKHLFAKELSLDIAKYYDEQLYTLSSEQSVVIVYYILLPETAMGTHRNAFSPIFAIRNTHIESAIISYALQRLQWKIEYTNVVYSLLPETFTLSELQNMYEAILHKKLDKRNFRKKILSLHFITATGKKRIGIARPAQTYRFTKRKPTMVNIFS